MHSAGGPRGVSVADVRFYWIACDRSAGGEFRARISHADLHSMLEVLRVQ
jgi:hypothetical protein